MKKTNYFLNIFFISIWIVFGPGNPVLAKDTFAPSSKDQLDLTGYGLFAESVSAGRYHTCALTSLGGVKCWGSNTLGRLGDSTTIDRNTPVNVVGLSNGILLASAGGVHTCALSSTGGVKCWGDNSYGQLGYNKLWVPVHTLGFGIDYFLPMIQKNR